MRSLAILFISAICYLPVQAQDDADTSRVQWQHGGSLNLGLAQGGTRNWSPGGDRFSLALNSFVTLYANRTSKKWNWDNLLELNYGLLNTTSTGIIKNDDKIDLNSRLSYKINSDESAHWRLGGHLNFRSQFTDGYDYDSSVKKRISTFLAPATFILSPGLEYYSNKTFNIHLSPYTGRWIIVANRPYELGENFGVAPNNQVKIEAGAFASINYKATLCRNIQYRSRLDLFSNYLSKPSNVDVFWTNILHMRINNYLGVVYNLDLQYDDDTKIFGYAKNEASTQLKSILGVGLSVTF